jgi:hypothetical protein
MGQQKFGTGAVDVHAEKIRASVEKDYENAINGLVVKLP